MKIEVGKTYRTRGGEKASVVERTQDPLDAWPFRGIIGRRERSWTWDGRAGIVPENDSFDDLIAEWEEPAIWEWFGHALHFCGSSRCKFHLGTKVGPWVVSTIGDYFPSPMREPLNSPVGDEKPLFYETVVFPVTGALGCGCPDHHGQEVDGRRYATAQEATAGHMGMCRKWESVPEGGSPQ